MMRRNRVQKPAVGMQLFPFLAVLICAMGALIVVLVLVVKHARVNAETIAEQRLQEDAESPAADEPSKSATDAQLAQEQEDLDWRKDLLTQQRTELTQQLADRRLELSHLEDHIRRLEQKWKLLQAQADDLKRVSQGRQVRRQSLDGELAQLQAELSQERQRLEQARQETAKRRRAFAIIPYRGPNGTERRPVYIECKATGIVIHPEGIMLTPEDMSGPLGPGNPLDATLRTIREHWVRVEGSARGSEPYPLLIVRPDGAVAYAVAREAMSSWEDEFGYELVDNDMELAFPPSDPALKQTLTDSIQTARQRQALLVAAMPRRFERMGGGSDRFPVPDGGGGAGGFGGGSGGGSAGLGGGSPVALGLRGSGGGGGAGVAGGTAQRAGSGNRTSAAGQDPGAAGSAATGSDGAVAMTSAVGMPAGGSGGLPNGSRGASPAGVAGGVSDGGTPNSMSGGGPGMVGSPAGGPGGGGDGGSSSLAGNAGGGAGGSASGNSGSVPGGSSGGTPGSSESGGSSREGFTFAGSPFSKHPMGRGVILDEPKKSKDGPAITRPIFIDCYADHLVIQPDRNTDAKPLEVSLPGSLRGSLDPLLKGLKAHMERWGIAVAGGYWKPVVKAKVYSGGEQRFEELKTVLEQNGIDVEKKEEPRRASYPRASLPS